MSENYGSDFITITDEDGKEYELEHLDTIELDGTFYLAFLPADVDEDSEEYGLLILKQEEEDGELFLAQPTEEEIEVAYEKFMERLFADEEEE